MKVQLCLFYICLFVLSSCSASKENEEDIMKHWDVVELFYSTTTEGRNVLKIDDHLESKISVLVANNFYESKYSWHNDSFLSRLNRYHLIGFNPKLLQTLEDSIIYLTAISFREYYYPMNNNLVDSSAHSMINILYHYQDKNSLGRRIEILSGVPVNQQTIDSIYQVKFGFKASETLYLNDILLGATPQSDSLTR